MSPGSQLGLALTGFEDHTLKPHWRIEEETCWALWLRRGPLLLILDEGGPPPPLPKPASSLALTYRPPRQGCLSVAAFYRRKGGGGSASFHPSSLWPRRKSKRGGGGCGREGPREGEGGGYIEVTACYRGKPTCWEAFSRTTRSHHPTTDDVIQLLTEGGGVLHKDHKWSNNCKKGSSTRVKMMYFNIRLKVRNLQETWKIDFMTTQNAEKNYEN